VQNQIALRIIKAILVRLAAFIVFFLLTLAFAHADTRRGNDAMLRKDYITAWREYIPSAQQGDPEAEAAIGAMLFEHLNPVGIGFYADCEKWLVASANQNNPHGEDLLAQFYYADGKRIAGGINPGINNSPISPQAQQMANSRFAQARAMFERAAAQRDGYAMGNLATMLDAGVGGPRDPARAAQLRAGVYANTDPNFAARINADPANAAITVQWQSGNYAQAIQNAQALANKGDATSEAVLGRAYYEGVGIARNYQYALYYLNKSVAQQNSDAMFILGLMYEHGRGVPQNFPKALQLFDTAAPKNRYAEMEAAGMRLQGESNRIAALAHRNSSIEDIACQTAGGTSSPEPASGAAKTSTPGTPTNNRHTNNTGRLQKIGRPTTSN
jgi:TPR repeat protein